MEQNQVIIIAGPNGAGKSTCAKYILPEFLKIQEYVNADNISLEIFGRHNHSNMVRPGKIMLRRIHELAKQKQDFAFETTLAPRSFAHWISSLTKQSYEFILLFIWLQSPDLAVERVMSRVKLGGHSVTEEVVRRRYWAGIHNFFSLYLPLASIWKVYDNSTLTPPYCIAYGHGNLDHHIIDNQLWNKFKKGDYGIFSD
ncbi:MAG TPA: zeta toxin family protein [Desulfohalobiaceae bacterium]|nr:zeta toxin family protein [Desulfohalobiaceae bacterium]